MNENHTMSHQQSLVRYILPFLVLIAWGCGEDDLSSEGEEPTTEATESLDSISNSGSDADSSVAQPAKVDASSEVASGRLFQDRANRVVGGTIPIVLIESIKVDGTTMQVKLQEVDDVPAYADYFEIADEANRIVALTSVRWFRDLPALQRLLIEIPTAGGPRIYELDRTEVARYYNLSIRELAKDPSEQNWRESFLARWDTPDKRKAFAVEHLR